MLLIVAGTSLKVVEAYRSIYLLVLGIAGTTGVIVMIYIQWKQIRYMKIEPVNPYEYLITKVRYGEKVEVECENGEKHVYNFPDLEHSAFKGEKQVMLVYFKEENQIFAEKMEVWRYIQSQ